MLSLNKGMHIQNPLSKIVDHALINLRSSSMLNCIRIITIIIVIIIFLLFITIIIIIIIIIIQFSFIN